MGTVVEGNFNFVAHLMTDLIRRQKPPIWGSTKRDTDRAEYQHRGWKDAKLEDLAAFATLLRVEKYRRLDTDGSYLKFISAIDGSSIGPFVRQHLEDWNNGRWKDKTDEEWVTDLTTEFLDQVVFPKEISDELERMRRQAVLAGQIEPTPEDAEWIAEERKAFAATLTPYDQALAKLGKKAGFSDRIPPQAGERD